MRISKPTRQIPPANQFTGRQQPPMGQRPRVIARLPLFNGKHLFMTRNPSCLGTFSKVSNTPKFYLIFGDPKVDRVALLESVPKVITLLHFTNSVNGALVCANYVNNIFLTLLTLNGPDYESKYVYDVNGERVTDFIYVESFLHSANVIYSLSALVFLLGFTGAFIYIEKKHLLLIAAWMTAQETNERNKIIKTFE